MWHLARVVVVLEEEGMSRPQVTKRYGQGQGAVVRMSAEEAWVGNFGEVAPWPRYG